MSQDIEAGLFALITSDPTINGMIGTRMYPEQLPEPPTLPAIRYTTAGGRSDVVFQGSGPQRTRYQFDCIAADPDTAKSLRWALTGLLDAKRFTLNDGTDVTIYSIQPKNFNDPDSRQFRCAQEFYVNFNRNTN